MSRPVLTRFDVFVYKPKNPPADLAQVAVPGAVVEFYRQGATASANATIGSSGGTIQVQGLGAIQLGSVLVAGTSSTVLLTVTAIGTSEITVVKPAGAPNVTITAGTRLFLVSDRPKVFRDPLGTASLGSSVQADATGRVEAYVSERRFDYVVAEGYFGIVSSASVSESSVLSWFHGDPGGSGKYAIIGISWTGSTGTGNPPYVTYGGVAMTLVAATGANAVYALINPPASSQVVASFDDTVAAVGGGVTVIAADVAAALKWGTSYGPSGDANLTIASPYLWGLVVDCLSLPQLPLGSWLDPQPADGQIRRWSMGVDLPDLFQVHGAGSTKMGPAGAISGTSWSALGGNEWNLAGVELKRKVLYSSIDVIGGIAPNPSWLNARDFASLRDAVLALPEKGGTVFLSSGNHVTDGFTLEISKPNVTLQGEGKLSTFIIPPAPNPGYDLIKATQRNFRILDLSIIGSATATSNYSCLVLSGAGVVDCMLRNVQITQAGHAGLVVDGIGSLLAVHVEFLANWKYGVEMLASTATPRRIRLVGCWANQNKLNGIVIKSAAQDPDLGNVLVYGCGVESNGIAMADSGIFIDGPGGVQVIASYFELGLAGTAPGSFIKAMNAKGLQVEGCIFGRGGEATAFVPHALVCEGCRQVSFVNNGAFGLASGSAMAEFSNCVDVVEYGNWNDFIGEIPLISGDKGFSLSRSSVTLPRHPEPLTPAPGIGALAWDETSGSVRLFDGANWRLVAYGA